MSVGEVTGAITGIDKFIIGTGPTHDAIRFTTNDFGSFAAVHKDMTQVGADVAIRLDGTDSITLDSVRLSSLVATGFKFL